MTNYFNPARTNAGITLSVSNSVATRNSGAAWVSTFSVDSHPTTDAVYWEVVVGALSGKDMIGVGSSAATLSSYVGSDANGWGYYGTYGGGSIFHSGASITASVGTFAAGSVVMLALSGGSLYVGVNGTWGTGVGGNTCNPVAGTGSVATGISAAMFAGATIYQGGDNLTLRVLASEFAYPIPTGYSAWGASSGTSVALTGQSASTGIGSGFPAQSSALSGQVTALSLGTLTAVSAGVNIALTGNALASARGSLAPVSAIGISGQVASWAQGTLTAVAVANVSVSLTGRSTAASVGAVSPQASIALAGESLSAGHGNVSPTTSHNVTVALVGGQASFALGSVTPLSGGITVALSGNTLSGGVGALVPASVVGVSGRSSLFLVGRTRVAGALIPVAPPFMSVSAESHAFIVSAEDSVFGVLAEDHAFRVAA